MFELAQVVLKKRVSNNYLDMSLYRARFLSMYDTHGPLEKKKIESENLKQEVKSSLAL